MLSFSSLFPNLSFFIRKKKEKEKERGYLAYYWRLLIRYLSANIKPGIPQGSASLTGGYLSLSVPCPPIKEEP